MAAALRSGLLRKQVLIARKCYRIVFQSATFLATETGHNEQRQCKGINYFKDGSDPPLLSDSEYPDWLWDILTDEKKRSRDEELPHDISNTTLRRRKNKQLRRQENATRKQNN